MSKRERSCAFVRHLDLELRPDASRTVIRPFIPAGSEQEASDRVRRITQRVLGFNDRALARQLARMEEALKEHPRSREVMLRRAEEIRPHIADLYPRDRQQRLLLGAYFSTEFAFEAAALFNPSIVRHPGGGEGAGTRFILSLRGTGEGHLSSVTFRTGTWHDDDRVTIDDPAPGGEAALVDRSDDAEESGGARLDCSGARDPSAVVLYPMLPSQSGGIEDLRLAAMTLADGSTTCIGTYTAVGDEGAQQEMLRTSDFRSFRTHAIEGDLTHGKGMALFPRSIGDRYLALSRHDSENIWLSSSVDLRHWREEVKILEPVQPWESVQIGNCGSPLEIEEGWLVLTHGVGVIRSYSLGAVLLDRDDPARVLGRLSRPLIARGDEHGYVPNVVYSCGGLVRGRSLLLPYSISDEFTRFAIVPIDDLIAAMD